MLLPDRSDFVSGEVTVFDKLVRMGEERSLITLPAQFHAFLVERLLEYVRDYAIMSHVVALSSLHFSLRLDRFESTELKRTGDAALLFAGLFPDHASYLCADTLGRSAYACLSTRYKALGRKEKAQFFGEAAKHFREMEDVLVAIQPRIETAQQYLQRLRLRAAHY